MLNNSTLNVGLCVYVFSHLHHTVQYIRKDTCFRHITLNSSFYKYCDCMSQECTFCFITFVTTAQTVLCTYSQPVNTSNVTLAHPLYSIRAHSYILGTKDLDWDRWRAWLKLRDRACVFSPVALSCLSCGVHYLWLRISTWYMRSYHCLCAIVYRQD